MAENMSFGDWRDVTPDAMKTYSEEKLHLAMRLNQGGVYDTWARVELQRRQMVSLQEATRAVHQEVTLLIESSRTLQQLTGTLVEETTHVHREVALLTSSSEKLEGLTTTLRNLTWVLIALTFLAAAVPIGIEVWKAKHETLVQVPSSAPQTPTVPR